MYIQGSAIDKKFKGSLEHQSLVVQKAIDEHFGDSPVRILATHQKHAYAIDGDGQMLKVTYKVEDDGAVVVKAKPTKDIPVIEDDNIPRFIAGQLRTMVEAASSGKEISRTGVREVAQLLDKDETYWVSDVLEKINEAADESEWFAMYEANQEKIRTSMYGNIREIESLFPSTRFAKIARSKLPKFEGELREALAIIADLANEMVDECNKMVFDNSQNEFFGAICESLNVEAHAVSGLLGKAEKLMRTEDVGRMADAHDRLAERAKTMAVVTAYLKTKSHNEENEE